MSPTEPILRPSASRVSVACAASSTRRSPCSRADRLERRQVARVPRVVHGHDRPGARRDGGRDGRGIEAERGVVDVDEDRPCARAHDHVGGRGPGQRRRDDLVAVALADPERAQREVHRRRAGGDGERERSLRVVGELALELPRERPGGQPAGLERAQHVGALLVAERGRCEVEPALAAHGRAAGDGGEIDRDGHGAQDRRPQPAGRALLLRRREPVDHELAAPGHDGDVAPDRDGRREGRAAQLAIARPACPSPRRTRAGAPSPWRRRRCRWRRSGWR